MQNARTSWTADDLGPAMVAFLRPCPGVEAIVVVDNVALGAAIGGVRMRPALATTSGMQSTCGRHLRRGRVPRRGSC
jgi:hypothetical protein